LKVKMNYFWWIWRLKF